MPKNKNIKVVSPSYRRVLLPDFSRGFAGKKDAALLGFNEAWQCVNFNVSTGALTEGYGLEKADLPEEFQGGVTSVFTYEKSDSGEKKSYLMACVRGEIFYRERNETAFTRLEGIRFTSPPSAITYRLFGLDVVLMLSRTDSMAVWDGVNNAYTVENAPPAKSAALHFERMFVCSEKDSSVWFSDDLDPTNWNPSLDEGGFIQLLDERGVPKKAISFLNYLYVFRERGISRLSAIGDQTQFTVSNLFVSADRIYDDTVAVCGDCIMFLSGEGLYRFDGMSARRILPVLDGRLIAGADACAVYAAGKYYLSCRTAVDGEEKPALFVLDLADGSYSFSVTPEQCSGIFTVLRDGEIKVVALCGFAAGEVKMCGKMFASPTRKVWQSGLIDLGIADAYKLIKDIYIVSQYEARITVSTESGEKSFDLKASELTQRIRVNLMGRRLSLKIECSGAKARILRPSLRLAVMKKL